MGNDIDTLAARKSILIISGAGAIAGTSVHRTVLNRWVDQMIVKPVTDDQFPLIAHISLPMQGTTTDGISTETFSAVLSHLKMYGVMGLCGTTIYACNTFHCLDLPEGTPGAAELSSNMEQYVALARASGATHVVGTSTTRAKLAQMGLIPIEDPIITSLVQNLIQLGIERELVREDFGQLEQWISDRIAQDEKVLLACTELHWHQPTIFSNNSQLISSVDVMAQVAINQIKAKLYD